MELFRALGALAEHPGPPQRRLGKIVRLPGAPDPADYAEVFDFQLTPYASVYVGADGMLGGEARDRVAGFWRALHLAPPAEPDHLAVLLALYAELADHAAAERDAARRLLWNQSRSALLGEHLASWIFPYLDTLERVGSPFYRAWGVLLRAALTRAIAADGLPDALPLHLREAPSLPDPRRAGASAFLRGLLAPVRSGMILVRADLERAGRESGLGVRMGDRHRVLEALLAQDPERTLAWLAAEARSWADRHRLREARIGRIARFWTARAEAAAGLLSELRMTSVGIRSSGADP
jgi:Nitrate reductase delta subunit